MFGVNPLGLSDLLGLCSQSGTFDQSAMGGSSSLNSILHNIAVFIIERVQVSGYKIICNPYLVCVPRKRP